MRWVVIFCLSWVWSEVIAADPPWPPEVAVTPVVTAPAKADRGVQVPRSDGKPRLKMPLDPDADLDRRAFLAAFQRQAQSELLPCLRQWQTPPSNVAVTALLDQGGYLLHLTSLDPTRALPDCALSAVTGMRFPGVAAGLRRPSVSLQWRLDW